MPDRTSPYIAGWRNPRGAGGSWHVDTITDGWHLLAAEVRRNGACWVHPYYSLPARASDLQAVIESLATALESHDRLSVHSDYLDFYVTDNPATPHPRADW